MINQPAQPLKFFSSLLEVEKDLKNKGKGAPGTHTITEDILFIPPFQIKFNNRLEAIVHFTIELINYNTGAVDDITDEIRVRGVFNYSDYQNLIVYRFPLYELKSEGDYYLRVSDGTVGGADIYEVWYSEVFKLCDLNRNLLSEMESPGDFTGWNSHSLSDGLATLDCYRIEVCESTGNGASFLSGEFYVTENEPLDFYTWSSDLEIDLACGEPAFLSLNFALVDSTGDVISNTVTIGQGAYKETLTPYATRYARLKGWVDAPNVGHGLWKLYLMYANPQLNDGLGTSFEEADENIGSRKVLRWSHSCNICDMIYEEQSGYVTADYDEELYWEMAYENYLILDDPPLVPEFEIKENVSENDKGDKLKLLAAQQDWHYLQIAAREHLARAMYNIHLHDTVEIDYNGEAHTICENSSEVTRGDDYNFTVKFRFREESCSVDACCFDIGCCPNLEDIEDVLADDGTLPACGEATNGKHYLSLILTKADGVYYYFTCNGTSWSYNRNANKVGNCLVDLDAVADEDQMPYMYFNGEYGNWYRFVHILSVTDGTDGTAIINLRSYSLPGLRVIAQVDGADTGDEVILEGTASETITVTTGAGNFDFTIRIVDDLCDYGVSNEVNEDITDV